MEDQELESASPAQPGSSTPREWPIALVLVGLLVAGLYLVLNHGIYIVGWGTSRLPLLLPLAVTLLSILTRAAAIRTRKAVLKISNDIAIGIISFDIWALSASGSSEFGRVVVNAESMIRGSFVVPLLLTGLVTAVGCVVLTNFPFKNQRAEHLSLLAGLLTSVVIYVLPFGLLEPVPAPLPPPETAQLHEFTVGIPYSDPDIVGFAPTFLRDRPLLRVEENVKAADPESAKALAIQRFMDDPVSTQVKSKSNEKVVVLQDQILVVEHLRRR